MWIAGSEPRQQMLQCALLYELEDLLETQISCMMVLLRIFQYKFDCNTLSTPDSFIFYLQFILLLMHLPSVRHLIQVKTG